MLSKKSCAKIRDCYSLPKILLIEDDMATVDVLQQFFHMMGYICVNSPTGDDLSGLLSKFLPSLIIVDYLLPTTNGTELCLTIKTSKATAAIPVIIYSAYPVSESEIASYGCDAFISKPFDLEVLVLKIEQLLSKSSRRSSISNWRPQLIMKQQL